MKKRSLTHLRKFLWSLEYDETSDLYRLITQRRITKNTSGLQHDRNCIIEAVIRTKLKDGRHD